MAEPWQRIVEAVSVGDVEPCQRRLDAALGPVEDWQRRTIVVAGEQWQRSFLAAAGEPWMVRKT